MVDWETDAHHNQGDLLMEALCSKSQIPLEGSVTFFIEWPKPMLIDKFVYTSP